MEQECSQLSEIKEASACLEASSLGKNSKQAVAEKAKRTKSLMKKADRVKEIKVGSFTS